MTASHSFQPIGIIGGMGPEATVLLMSRIIASTQVQDDCDHIPLFVDNNPQIPSRIKALLEKTGEDPGPVIARMAKGLEQMGAKALAMPCNTAHHFADVINKSATIPLLNMIELSMQKLISMGLDKKTIGVLCSPAAREVGVFTSYADKHAIDLRFMQDETPLLRLIQRVKQVGADQEAQIQMHNICSQFIKEGIDALLIACSELSLLANIVPEKIIYVDTVDVLANACVEYAGGQIRLT